MGMPNYSDQAHEVLLENLPVDVVTTEVVENAEDVVKVVVPVVVPEEVKE